MLDLTGIVFSSFMMIVVILRAVQLDSRMPWFQKLPARAEQPVRGGQPWRRRG